MIEHRVLLAACHKGEASQVCKHGPHAILSVEPKQAAFARELMESLVTTDGGFALPQFLPVEPVASVAKGAEPLETVGLADDRASPHHLPTFAPSVTRSTDLIEPTRGRGSSSVWGKAR
ncbi:hypothetical protein KSB_66810 [Ktedonobacter robiniae]|uniref:Uncharacterized protein n=1 Tax=Ktedonobacter robiniae TaxID=2778365 RepID=A0ABQ3UZ90_9CHLR|nr:hypothetical protein KSB_66810 [Ktedonobacter robiniae]